MSSTTLSQPLILDNATFETVLRGTVDSLPRCPQAKPDEIAARREAAVLAVSALCPRDPFEAMLAARIIGAHHHAMHDLACAAQSSLPPALQLRYQGRAVALSRLIDASLRDLLNRQTAPARQPQGQPAAVGPDSRKQPAPQAIQADAPPAPEAIRADPPPTPPQPGKTRSAPLNKAVADQLRVEAAARAHTVVGALAA